VACCGPQALHKVHQGRREPVEGWLAAFSFSASIEPVTLDAQFARARVRRMDRTRRRKKASHKLALVAGFQTAYCFSSSVKLD
jgi:hypothetical protein